MRGAPFSFSFVKERCCENESCTLSNKSAQLNL